MVPFFHTEVMSIPTVQGALFSSLQVECTAWDVIGQTCFSSLTNLQETVSFAMVGKK